MIYVKKGFTIHSLIIQRGCVNNQCFCLPFRTTAFEELEEGAWQVSVVSTQADEVSAERRPNTKVSAKSWVWSF